MSQIMVSDFHILTENGTVFQHFRYDWKQLQVNALQTPPATLIAARDIASPTVEHAPKVQTTVSLVLSFQKTLLYSVPKDHPQTRNGYPSYEDQLY